jgi:arylsulfatase A-like enzyme/tetratricopeptide (TPR) repeat protein
LVVVLVAGFGCGGDRSPEPPPPASETGGGPFELEDLNVILITIDTLRSDRVSCYGPGRVETPVMDGFAREGVRFSNASSTVPFTLPAHTSILTGLYPPGHGVRENVGYTVDDELTTLAEALSTGGWSTAAFVSAFVLDSRWGIAQGFDRYFDDFDLSTFDEAPNLSAVQRSGDLTIAEAERWLDERNEAAPFFLWLHLYDPHDPYTPPEPYLSRHPNRPYDGEVAYTDALLGGFRRSLEERGLLEDSLVVLTSDHGEGLGDHGESSHGFFIYDSTIHVPLIIRPPGGAAGGGVVDTAVSHVDLFPTILDVVGIEPPQPVHGRSLLPLMKGQEAGWDREVYAESLYPLLHYGWAPLRSVRTDRHKLISAPRPEVYDLRVDPKETRDLSSGRPTLVTELEGHLSSLRSTIDVGAVTAAPSPDLDPQTLAQLQALGYAAGQGGVDLAEEEARPRVDPKDRIGVHRTVMRAQTQMRNDPAAARRALLGVLEQDDVVLDAHQMLGQLAVMEREYDEALGHFRNALELEPEHRNSLKGMASAYKALGRAEEALVGYRRLLEVAGTDTGASLAIADIEFARGNFDTAVETLRRAEAASEAPGLISNKMGEIRAEQGRSDEAMTLFEDAIGKNELYAVPYFNLAVLREERGEIREAIGLYETSIELAPHYFQAQFNLGLLVGRMGDSDRQLELWEASIEANPEFVEGHFYLAKALMDREGSLSRAETLVRRGIELDPNGESGPLGYYVLADILNRTGRAAEAQRAVAEGRRIQDGMS